jgi:simple sugar transport system permease protein
MRNILKNWQVEKIGSESKVSLVVVPLLSLIFGLIFAGIFFWATGKNPLMVYILMFQGAFGSAYGLSETVVKAIPLILSALAVSLAFRMKLWNIGAEGQIYMGAFAAAGVALTFPQWPSYLLFPERILK